ncbi:MAG: hypothetical protein HY000_41840, partial [Planctomycetes bacterium]|nr:hypothetical protein [Planctomycetota bacterium]
MMALGRGFSQWLAAARLLPPRQRADELLAGSDDLASAFNILVTNWEQLLARASSPQVRRRAEASIATLRHCQDRAAEYWTAGDPRVPILVTQWLGTRDWWWSGAAPSGYRIAIVSSRLPRLLEPNGPWLRAVRAALDWAHERAAIIVAGWNTAGSELALRGAVRRGLTTVAIRCCDLKARSIQTWTKQWAASLKHSPGTGAIDLWALPVDMASAGPEPEPPSELYSVPENDRAAFAWADELIVLALRPGGNLHTLLRHRFAQPNARVFLVDLPGLQPARIRDELVPLGAMIWSPEKENTPKLSPSLITTNSQSVPARRDNPRSPVPVPSADGWAFLTHCTRACVGPWPGQSRDDYLDSLLDGGPDSDHSAVAALLRIVTRRRLVASSQAIRGRYPVVSFTAASLAELPR